MIIVQSLSVVPCFGEFQVHFAPDQSDLMTSPSMKVSCSSGSIIEKTLQIRSKGEAHLIHVITTSNSIFFQGEKMRRMKNINWFAEGAGREENTAQEQNVVPNRLCLNLTVLK